MRWRLVTVKTREPMQRQKVQLSPIIHQPFPLFIITEYLDMELLILYYGGDGASILVLQKVASELHPKVRNHREGPY